MKFLITVSGVDDDNQLIPLNENEHAIGIGFEADEYGSRQYMDMLDQALGNIFITERDKNPLQRGKIFIPDAPVPSDPLNTEGAKIHVLPRV